VHGSHGTGRLAKLLDDAEEPGAFSAQIMAPADALQVEVDGVGVVQTPVRAPLAKKLIAVARPAMFGRGEQTLTDTTVRDTWEITSDLVTLSGPAWEATLGAVLDDVRDELGLPPTTKLRAELHVMLVYGKGQFFLPHQDSEKNDAMVGTLVVSLPSAHTAGNWSWSMAARASRTGCRGRGCLSSRSTRTAVTRSSP
jgi:hypothetical protein